MKNIVFTAGFLLSALCCNAQYFDLGITSREFNNENQAQQVYGTTPSGYITNGRAINGDLFIERVMNNDMYFRLAIGTTRTTSNTLYQDINEEYFADNIILLSKTYTIEHTTESYDAAIGIGKIFRYHKFSLRAGAALAFIRFQTTNTTTMGVIENSDYADVNSYTSQTPYNEYLLNCFVSLHYTFWKGLSAGFQIDNWISYEAEKTTATTTTQGFATGGIPTTVTSSSNDINNKAFTTTFLTPAISIIYSFQKQEAPVNSPKTNKRSF